MGVEGANAAPRPSPKAKGASPRVLLSRQLKRHPGLIPLIGFIGLGLGSAALYLLRLALFSPDVRPQYHVSRGPGYSFKWKDAGYFPRAPHHDPWPLPDRLLEGTEDPYTLKWFPQWSSQDAKRGGCLIKWVLGAIKEMENNRSDSQGIINWDRKNNPEPWNKISPNDQYKFMAVSTDYKSLKKDRPDF